MESFFQIVSAIGFFFAVTSSIVFMIRIVAHESTFTARLLMAVSVPQLICARNEVAFAYVIIALVIEALISIFLIFEWICDLTDR